MVSCLNNILSFFTFPRSITSAGGPSLNHLAMPTGDALPLPTLPSPPDIISAPAFFPFDRLSARSALCLEGEAELLAR